MTTMRPLGDWPLLLCGPMLRRVTPTSVAVFVVTQQPCLVALVVKHADGSGSTLTGAQQHTRPIGALLHVCVCVLDVPAPGLVSGVLYAYDVEFTPATLASPTPSPGTPVQRLADMSGLLSGSLPLGYLAGSLPTFALPPPLDHLNIIHSSCRKPHGGGHDAFALVDRMIATLRHTPSTVNTSQEAFARPHQLLLTGDQIYADDVALTLLPVLMSVGDALLGEATKERIPPGNVLMTAAEVAPGTAREKFLTEHSKISSDKKSNHLMFWAEFVGMYMLAWSDELWARDASGGPHHYLVEDVAPKSEGANSALADRERVLDYADTVRQARRVMANVPTLMMLDDHEISDDWNLDRDWRDSGRIDPVTHRIVRNGLLAFALFQAWGNDPSVFASLRGKELLDLITVPNGGSRTPLAVTASAADALLDISPSGDVAQGDRVLWDWMIDGPEHRVIALDTRTHRGFRGARNPVELLTTSEMQRQLTARKPVDNRLVVLISPAPVVGHPLVEEVLQPHVARREGGRAADNEPWCAARPAFEEFLRRLAGFQRIVIVSGDVHYGYTNHTAYFGPNGMPPARVVQLCSSSAKNSDQMTRAIQAAGYLGMRSRGWFGFPEALDASVRPVLRAAVGQGAADHSIDKVLRQLYFSIVYDRFDAPAVIPNGPWITSQATATVESLVGTARPTDWAYLINFVLDVRSPSARRSAAGLTGASPVSQGARDVVANGARAVVGETNVGQLTFTGAGSALSVVHRLHWLLEVGPGPGDRIPTYTEHVCPLAPPTSAERPQPFRLPVADTPIPVP
jgi:hypothetical protein